MSDVNYYLSLNYHKRLYQEDGDWIVEVDDFPGCVADGRTPDEAVENLRHAMKSWIESRVAAGFDIPEPSGMEEYSGKILVRMPRFLHRRLSLQAKAEGVSLNQYLGSLLADASARTNVLGGAFMQNLGSLPFRCWDPSNAYVATGQFAIGQAGWAYARGYWSVHENPGLAGVPAIWQTAPLQLPAPQSPRGTA